MLKIIILLIILIFSFSATGSGFQVTTEYSTVSNSAILKYQIAQKDPTLSDEEKIKTAIEAYFTLGYESQKNLIQQDFAFLIDDTNQDWVKLENVKRDLLNYISTIYQTSIVDYKFKLDYDIVEIKGENANITLRESNEIVTSPEMVTSRLGNLSHTITLRYINDSWKISKDEYHDEYTNGLKFQNVEELQKQVDQNFQFTKQSKTENSKTVYASSISKPARLVTHGYNGTSAKNYADTYWNTTNPPYYSGLSSDCANFVSQAIYAGEGKTPPDTSGMTTSSSRSYTYDWYYVWSNSGSIPWVQVAGQYSFITGNSSRIGPYGSGSSQPCDARVGDVIQIQDSTGWFHEGIVSYKASTCLGLQSIYVDAHTTNRQNYQLTNWSMYQMRTIRINGWRSN